MNIDNLEKSLSGIFRPYICSDKIRIGSKYDGGYILPKNVLEKIDCVISFGVSTNIDFETEIKKLVPNLKILMFDPFIGFNEDLIRLFNRIISKSNGIKKRNLVENKNYKSGNENLFINLILRLFHWIKFYKFVNFSKYVIFNKIGIASSTEDKFIDFNTLNKNNDLTYSKSILLKIDIEGNEYEIIDHLINNEILKQTDVLIFEFHDLKFNLKIVESYILNLENKGLYLYHIHANNSDELISNTNIPNTIEVSFCKKDYCNILIKDFKELPDIEIDSPCNPKFYDHNIIFSNDKK